MVTGEPNDASGEDCTQLRTDGFWNDASCELEKKPMCEKVPGLNYSFILYPLHFERCCGSRDTFQLLFNYEKFLLNIAIESNKLVSD